jgi:hypothetical protein
MNTIKIIYLYLIGALFFLFSVSCSNDAQILSAQPSLLEQDTIVPVCSGITSLSVSAGPSITVTWGQGTDNFSLSNAITYKIFMRKNAESYDLISPAKIITGATSTLISNGVSVGNTYTLFVTCTDEKGNTSPSGPTNEQAIAVSDTQAPSQITTLAATSPTFNSILLTWSPSDDGLGGTTAGNMTYKVFASLSTPVSTAGAPTATVNSGGTSYLHSGLSPATTWHYKVIAVDGVGNNSVDSNEATNTTLTDVTVPTFAGNTSSAVVTSATTSTIGLSWTAASDTVTATAQLVYRVYRCTGSTSCDPYAGALVSTTAAGVVTYTDTGLLASTVYVYGIRAMDTSNNISTNTDTKITSTSYSSSGSLYAYPTIEEVNIRMGQSIAVANVVGAATGPTAYPDLLVGAPNASEPGISYGFTGCIFVFAGTGVGTFSSTATSLICQPNPIASGNQNGLNFGTAIDIGDMDADGIPDIVVSNPVRSRVFIYRTLNTAGTLSIGTSPSTITHPTSNTTFGVGLCIGNSDNVGASDLFIATSSEDCNVACGGITGTGNILVFNNTSTAGTFIAPSSVSYKISPTQNLISSGYSISNTESVARACTIGNFDAASPAQTQIVIGSGTVSIGAGVGSDGMVAFYRKTAANTFAFQNVYPTSVPSITGNNWGDSLTKIQLDTGAHELLVGAPRDSNAGNLSGAAVLYRVGTSVSNFTLTDTGDAYYGGTDFENNGAGSAVAAADIWNHGDGTQDMVIGAYLDDNTMTIGANSINLGQVFTHRNTAGTISPTAQQSNFDTSNFRVRTSQLYGNALCTGDTNNDGLQDLIVGAPLSDYDPTTLTNNSDIGAIYIYYGKSTGEMDFANPSQIIYAPGAQNSSYFGNSCVVMDYNADGQQDLVVGSPYRDVVQANRGTVYVYYGTSNTPLPSSNSATLNAPISIANGLFGWSLATGDFDNNGYADLAVGATGINSGAASSGTVYVFWADNTTHAIGTANMTTINPPTGLLGAPGNPYLTNTQAISANQNFGRSLESFKSVGSSSGVDLVICSLVADVAINYIYSGSPAATDIGNCWIYEGRVNGVSSGLPNASYQIMTTPKNEIRYPAGYSTPANSIYFGADVSKGDMNADGTEDLIVCASRQTNLDLTVSNAGGCFAYYGLATGGFSQYTGYNGNAATNRYSPHPDHVFYNPNGEPSTASRFGEASAMLDINNNGTLDLIIGEPYSDNPSGPTNLGADAGRVYIIRGGY